MNLYTLKEILGHSDIKQTQVYASLSPDSLAQEMEREHVMFEPQEGRADSILFGWELLS